MFHGVFRVDAHGSIHTAVHTDTCIAKHIRQYSVSV